MSTKLLPFDEALKDGYIQEANRLFFHPLGLALAVHVERLASGVMMSSATLVIEDHRYTAKGEPDPSGYAFADLSDVESARKASTINELQQGMNPDRQSLFGWVIQPIGSKLDAPGSALEGAAANFARSAE